MKLFREKGMMSLKDIRSKSGYDSLGVVGGAISKTGARVCGKPCRMVAEEIKVGGAQIFVGSCCANSCRKLKVCRDQNSCGVAQ